MNAPSSCASQCGPKLETAEKPEIFADSVNRAQLIGAWLGESPIKDGSSVKFITQRPPKLLTVYWFFVDIDVG